MARRWRASNAGIAALAAGLILASARFAASGDWHSGNGLVCSDCHTMHNSSGGQPMRYDNDPQPSAMLLRHASTLSLCVYCHDGAVAGSPDVVAPVTYVPNPNAGFFPTQYSQQSGTAHVLAPPTPLTPPGGSQPMTLVCTTCHDPHGSPNYRNLRTDPAGTGTVSISVMAKQTVLPNGSNPEQVYVPGNVTYKSGISEWCGACHGQFHGRTSGQEGTGTPWLRHPQDQTISAGGHVDYGAWSGTVANRVPVQSPNDDVVPSTDDQVFCLSCHKAHGSANRAAMFFSDGATLTSTCQQCHNK